MVNRHPLLLQRRVLLLDRAPDLRLLAIGAVGRDHSERHAGVLDVIDRVRALPGQRERGRLHALALLGRQLRHQCLPFIRKTIRHKGPESNRGVSSSASIAHTVCSYLLILLLTY